MVTTDEELNHRLSLWSSLKASGNTTALMPGRLRELSIYGGQRGIWIDRKRTGALTDDGRGVTICLLHTGRRYPDDVSTHSMIYHYPDTLIPGKDSAENGEVYPLDIYFYTYIKNLATLASQPNNMVIRTRSSCLEEILRKI